MKNRVCNKLAAIPIRFSQGMAVGLGGILPGVSGGTLCAMFGMYRPLVDCIAHPVKGLRKHWWNMLWFGFGGIVGFIGLAGVSGKLFEAYPNGMLCVFLGLLAGSLPTQWKEAGSKGRKKSDLAGMVVCFGFLVGLLALLEGDGGVSVPADRWGFLLCGVMWGFSLLLPGLCASSLLMFFGLYTPMLLGIALMMTEVLVPLGIGLVGCVLLFGKLLAKGFEKWYSLLSHCVLGFVLATAVMLLPSLDLWWENLPLLGLGGVVGWLLTIPKKPSDGTDGS